VRSTRSSTRRATTYVICYSRHAFMCLDLFRRPYSPPLPTTSRALAHRPRLPRSSPRPGSSTRSLPARPLRDTTQPTVSSWCLRRSLSLMLRPSAHLVRQRLPGRRDQLRPQDARVDLPRRQARARRDRPERRHQPGLDDCDLGHGRRRERGCARGHPVRRLLRGDGQPGLVHDTRRG
jgi:hypothetical protein